MRVEHATNLGQLERLARRRLPRRVHDVVAGGADDERALGRNRAALEQLRLRPRLLADVRRRDPATTLFGRVHPFPLLLGPVGYQRLVHRDGEVGTARAASEAGVTTVLSGGSSYRPDEVVAAASVPCWYQLYTSDDRDRTGRTVERVADLGFEVLCVTVDTPMHAVRTRDVTNRISMPLRATPGLVAEALRTPSWAVSHLTGGAGHGLPSSRRFPRGREQAHATGDRSGRVVDRADLAWLRERWHGPLVVKGVLRGEDVGPLLDLGVDGVVVSNHGGRQLDLAPATIEVLGEVLAAADGRLPVLVDGGFRRGAEIVAAVAMGAAAVLIGRPQVFALAAGGPRGVRHLLALLAAEIDTTMGLLGCATRADLTPDLVQLPARSARS